MKTAKEVFENNVKVWFFGSRVDPTKRGMDIDLYIEVDIPKEEILDRKAIPLVRLNDMIGEQKVDLIIRPPQSGDKISITIKRSEVRLLSTTLHRRCEA